MASKEVENHQNISKNLKKDKAFNSLRNSMDNKAYYSAKILFCGLQNCKILFFQKRKILQFPEIPWRNLRPSGTDDVVWADLYACRAAHPILQPEKIAFLNIHIPL